MTDTRSLATRLNPWIGTTTEIESAAEVIGEHAREYARLQEAWASVEMTDAEVARAESREAALEAILVDLVSRLPVPDEGPWSVRFQGDPRGWTVVIVAPDGGEVGADV